MIFMITIVVSCILATDSSHTIKRGNLTPKQQYVRINAATRELNSRYSLKMLKIKKSGRLIEDVFDKSMGTLMDFLKSLGKGKTTQQKVPDIKIGLRRHIGYKWLTNHRVSGENAAKVYRKQCQHRRHCNVGSGIFGECFTNAMKFAMSFGWDSINSVTFEDTEKYAAVVYPNNICSVVNNLNQNIMNFYFGRWKKKKKKKVGVEATAAFSTVLSSALQMIIDIIEKESKTLEDCVQLPGKTILRGNGSLVNCYDECVICGFKGMTPLPEIEVTPAPDKKTANASIPWLVPPVSVDITQENDDGSKEIMQYNIDNINVYSNVTFIVGDEFKFKEVNVDMTKIGGLEGITNNTNLTEKQKNKVKGAIGKVVQEQLKDVMKKLNGEIGKKIQEEIKKKSGAKGKGG